MARRFSAEVLPFGLATTSKETFCPSLSPCIPARSTALMRTKTSWPPSFGRLTLRQLFGRATDPVAVFRPATSISASLRSASTASPQWTHPPQHARTAPSRSAPPAPSSPQEPGSPPQPRETHESPSWLPRYQSLRCSCLQLLHRQRLELGPLMSLVPHDLNALPRDLGLRTIGCIRNIRQPLVNSAGSGTVSFSSIRQSSNPDAAPGRSRIVNANPTYRPR